MKTDRRSHSTFHFLIRQTAGNAGGLPLMAEAKKGEQEKKQHSHLSRRTWKEDKPFHTNILP